MKKLIRLLFITSLILLVASCGSSRKSGAIGGGPYTPAPDGRPSERPAPLEWTDMKVPVSVKISSPASLRVGGTMTMVNGESVHISLRMLGFEVGAAYLTGDSIFAYAKLQRVYVAESISRILGGVNATVADLQSLLIGAPLTLAIPSGNTAIDMLDDPATGQPLSITVSHPSGRTASVTYTPLEGAPLATEVDITAATAGKRLAATLTYDWAHAEIDRGVSRAFSIPKGYRRINGDALLRSLADK